MEKKRYQISREWFSHIKECQNNPEGLASHRLRTFLRLKAFPEMVLFAEAPDSYPAAVRSALFHFANRFPTFVICIYSGKTLHTMTFRKDARLPRAKTFGSGQDALAWARASIGEMVSERFDADAEAAEKYYSEFYNSQFIQDRLNIKVQRQRMAEAGGIQKGSIEWKAMRRERFVKPNTTLRQFC